MPRLLRLAHIALISPDPERLADAYVSEVGLVRSGADPLRLTTNGYSHCLELHEGEPGLHHLAFEVRDVTQFPGTEIHSPGYAAATELEDPEGNRIRLVAKPSASDAIAPGDREFRPRKLAHVGLRAEDPEAQVAFYEQLGFTLSDWIGEEAGFLRCNPDHHVLAFLKGDGPRLHHVAYEVSAFDDFARQADRLVAHGARLEWGPGRHGPSGAHFIYFADADGGRVGWVHAIRQIADGHVPEVHQPEDWNVWGPPPPPGFF
jgi:catechol 2,3-dioxygenase-like lactoylglutathione lyase family enzyme